MKEVFVLTQQYEAFGMRKYIIWSCKMLLRTWHGLEGEGWIKNAAWTSNGPIIY